MNISRTAVALSRFTTTAIRPDESIGEALRRLQVRGLRMLPVVDPDNPWTARFGG